MPRSAGPWGSERRAEPIDAEQIRAFVERWFTALAARDADALVAMTNSEIVVRPFLARRPVDAVSYYGHEGIRAWVASLDSDLTITLNLIAIDSAGPQSAIVHAEVYFEREGARTGGPSFSIWRFDQGKLSEAIGYGTREDALDAERGSWH